MTDDIHSLYVDGELEGECLAQYKEHIAQCPACRKRASEFARLHEIFMKDFRQTQLSVLQKQQCFDRLLTNLNYKIHTTNKPSFARRFATAMLPYALASVLVFSLLLPALSRAGDTQSSTHLSVIKRNDIAQSPSNILTNTKPNLSNSALLRRVNLLPNPATVNSILRKRQHQPSTEDIIKNLQSNMTEVDFFRPDFDDDYVLINMQFAIPTNVLLLQN